ncbi:MAG: glycine--tRNA ligase subunit beta, partial [Alphaproteobacteria bacterium]|nr:glycine--tRNA ligase subunit beta [Alphaproteobacteria bacterium]
VLRRHFEDAEQECGNLIAAGLPLPAYDQCIKASHRFNLLDARGAVSVADRAAYIARVRGLAKQCCELWANSDLAKLSKKNNAKAVVNPDTVSMISDPPAPVKENPELLFEILCEELPARFQPLGEANLKAGLEKKFKELHIEFGEISLFSTPRRLGVAVSGLAQMTPPRVEERKGPKVSAPDAAIAGFLRSAGLNSRAEATVRDGVYFAVKTIAGEPLVTVLPVLLAQLVVELEWPKSMRWGTGKMRFARPIRNLLAVFGGVTLPGGLHLGRLAWYDGESDRDPGFAPGPDYPGDENYLPFTNFTFGHRFLSNNAQLVVSDSEDYTAKLYDNFVAPFRENRRDYIEVGDTTGDSTDCPYSLPDDEPFSPLVNEISCLAEFPQLIESSFDSRFLYLPPELIRLTLGNHQRYLTITEDDQLTNRYLFATNNYSEKSSYSTEQTRINIINGNNRVLTARLSDAEFYWQQDKKIGLDEFRRRLVGRAYHAKLGSMLQKSDRLGGLMEQLLPYFQQTDWDNLFVDKPQNSQDLRRAAVLCKGDLASGIVGEFPELQGTISFYLADENYEIRHYICHSYNYFYDVASRHLFLQLVDQLDHLVAFFAIGEVPTGSKDPFALRRSAMVILHVMTVNRCQFDLRDAIGIAAQILQAQLPQIDFAAAESPVYDFLKTRFFNSFEGKNSDIVQAISQDQLENDLFWQKQKIEEFIKIDTDLIINLTAGYRRANNILSDEEAKGEVIAGLPQKTLFKLEEERNLADRLHAGETMNSTEHAIEPFRQAIEHLGKLRAPIDDFFAAVKVNVDDPAIRLNRLRLLKQLCDTMAQIADFSLIDSTKNRGGSSRTTP